MGRQACTDLYSGITGGPAYLPTVSFSTPYVTPSQSSPYARYQTPIKRPDANVQPVYVVRPQIRA